MKNAQTLTENLKSSTPLQSSQSKSSQSKFVLYLTCCIAALSGLLFGYDTGVISGAILFIRKDFGLTEALTEGVVSAVLLGALVGAGFGGKLTDSFGRKKVLVSSAVLFIVGSLTSAFSPDPTYLILSRILLGVAIGACSFAAPLYLAEIAPPEIRGKLVTLNQLAITLGILASYCVDYFLAGNGVWRWMLGIGIVPAFAFLVGLIFLPESPRWMILRGGQDDKARNILKTIREPDQIEKEMTDIRQSLSQTESDWRLLLTDWVRPALFIAIALSIFQQTTGINTLIYYAPSILQMAGFEQAKGAILATLGLGLVNVLATVVSLPLIDRWGRRPLLLMGLSGMFFSLALIGSSFLWAPQLAVGGMVLYIISFAMSLGPICWLIVSEIIPLRVRGVGASVATSVNWSCNLIVAMTFLTLVRHLGPTATFWIYAGVCVIAWLFVYFVVPETKGYSLEQIESQLKDARAAQRQRRVGVSEEPTTSF